MKKRTKLLYLAYTAMFALSANCALLCESSLWWMIPSIGAFLAINGLAGFLLPKTKRLRMRVCSHGAAMLYIFMRSLVISLVVHIVLAIQLLPYESDRFLLSVLVCAGAHFLLFWNGIICIYSSSLQLGAKHRIIGAVCGMIPVVNLIVLSKLIEIVSLEVVSECERERLNEERKEKQLCRTKYPILLVHGVFFRDNKHFNYWGRIPEDLQKNGAVVYYGNHGSAARVADSAKELADRIKEIVRESGCEKVNIIAHSKGGLDCRYALAYLDIGDHVASLTTINTPHRGCEFADFLLEKIPEDFKARVANTYNAAMRKLGDRDPDFIAAVSDLTASACKPRDLDMTLPEGIYAQSYGSVMPKASGGAFPLSLSYHIVRLFDGPNDGLVGAESFSWSSKYVLLTPNGSEGISHADVIDLGRRDVDGFDVREFYVELVNDLKNRGL